MPKIKSGLPRSRALSPSTPLRMIRRVVSTSNHLPKGERLIKNRDFSRVFKQGKKAGGGDIAVAFAQGSSGASRIGISVPKAAVKQAARRNRAKRLLREAYRRNKAAVRHGYDMVVTCRQVPAGYREAEALLIGLLERARLIQAGAKK